MPGEWLRLCLISLLLLWNRFNFLPKGRVNMVEKNDEHWSLAKPKCTGLSEKKGNEWTYFQNRRLINVQNISLFFIPETHFWYIIVLSPKSSQYLENWICKINKKLFLWSKKRFYPLFCLATVCTRIGPDISVCEMVYINSLYSCKIVRCGSHICHPNFIFFQLSNEDII